jgi:hypothetical protein
MHVKAILFFDRDCIAHIILGMGSSENDAKSMVDKILRMPKIKQGNDIAGKRFSYSPFRGKGFAPIFAPQ